MISVARNAHIPRMPASFCWARSSNWCATSGLCPWPCPPSCAWASSCPPVWWGRSVASVGSRNESPVGAVGLADTFGLLFRVVLVRLARHDRRLVEVLGGRGGGGLPLQRGA